MRDILIEQGVPDDRLILEDQAQSTKENFRNIAGIVSVKDPVVMISSNYHMDRAFRIASENGFYSCHETSGSLRVQSFWCQYAVGSCP